jgi:hypothetical protein
MSVFLVQFFFFPILKLKNKIKGSRETKSKAMAICLLSQGQLMQPSPIFSVLYTIISPKPPISFHPTKKKKKKKKAHQFSFSSLQCISTWLILFFVCVPSLPQRHGVAYRKPHSRNTFENTRKMTLDLIQIQQRSEFFLCLCVCFWVEWKSCWVNNLDESANSAVATIH